MRTRAGVIGIVAAVVATLVVAGCVARTPSRVPDMQGAHVAAHSGSGTERTLRLEVDVDAAKQAGIADAGEGYDVASVRVDGKTVLLRKVGDGVEKATVDEVISARFLNVWFTGAVAESYPVQATAATVLIVE